MNRTLVFTMKVSEQDLDQLQKIIPDWTIYQGKDKSQWQSQLKDAEVIVGWNAEAAKECLQNESKLRWVQVWSAGVNNMPMDQFKEKNIYLTNSSGVHAFPISEIIFALMLSFTRNLHIYMRNQMEAKWGNTFNPLEMHGKTIGILGVGVIGKETARIAKAFQMRVLGFRRSGSPDSNVDQMYDQSGLMKLLSESDYIVNTLPSTEETFHMINTDQFNVMKPTAFYVNIGRGDTTNTKAMIDALQSKQIAGAGLDVFEQEPLPESSPLWNMENVIITPHKSGQTDEYHNRALSIFRENLKAYLLRDKPDVNLVDFEKKY